MSTTYTLQIPTTEDYDLKLKRIPLAGHANFALTSLPPVNENPIATFTYSAGAAADILTATVKHSYNAKQNMTNVSLRLAALEKTVVSETGEVTYSPVEAVIAWNHSGKTLLVASDMVTLLSVAMSIIVQELTGANGTPTTKVVDQLDHSVVSKLFS